MSTCDGRLYQNGRPYWRGEGRRQMLFVYIYLFAISGIVALGNLMTGFGIVCRDETLTACGVRRAVNTAAGQ